MNWQIHCKHFLSSSDSSINRIGIDNIPDRCLSSLYISSENASFSPVALATYQATKVCTDSPVKPQGQLLGFYSITLK